MKTLEFILNNKNYLEDLITRSTYHSNAIEGSTLTYAETYAILYNDNSFKIEGKEPREIYEAINHKKALELVFKNLQKKEEFDERFIKKINETINRDIKDTEGYRAVQVFIQGSEHIPPEPEKIPNLMMYYIYNYNHDEQDVFAKIARYHIEFERIHPFEDGNGRTGRRYCRHQDHLSVCGRYSKSVGSDRRAFRYGNQMYQRLYCTSEREWLPKLSSGYLLSCRDIKWPEKDPGRDSDTNDGNEFLGNHRAFSAV